MLRKVKTIDRLPYEIKRDVRIKRLDNNLFCIGVESITTKLPGKFDLHWMNLEVGDSAVVSISTLVAR